jgi:hypothetical protein
LPAADVHELEVGARHHRLMQRGVQVAGLGGQVVSCLFPGGNELVSFLTGHFERVDQNQRFSHHFSLRSLRPRSGDFIFCPGSPPVTASTFGCFTRPFHHLR